MIIDFHAHTWVRNDAEQAMAREAKLHGVDRICISGLRTYEPGLDEVRELNDRVYAACRAFPDLYLGFTYVNPLHGQDAMDELQRGLDNGAVGVKLWVSCHAVHESVMPIAEFAITHDLPLLQHAWHKITGNLPGESDPLHVAELANRYPELKLVMAHLGGDWRYGLKAAREAPTLLIDTSGSMADWGCIERWVSEIGADRIIWGTDMPGIDLLFTLSKVRDADITSEEKRKILGVNAARLLKIPT